MDSYAPHTVFNFESEVAGKDTTISILQKGYPYPGLTPKVRCLGAAPVLRREQRDRIHGSSLQIFAQSDIDGEFAALGTSDGSAFLVTVERAGELIFRGFVTPELYSEPDIPVPYDVEINATDCLGELKWKTFGDAVGSGDMTVEALLTKLVRASGIDYDVTRMFRWCLIKAYTASDGRTYDLRNLYLNLDNRGEDRAYDVLNDLLLSMNADLFISGNYVYLFRKTDFDRENQPDYGEYLSLKYGINGYWPVGNLTTTLLPAKKRVTVENDCELIEIPFNYTSYNLFTAPFEPKVDIDLVIKGYKRQYSTGSVRVKVAMFHAVGQAVYLTESGGLSNTEVWGPTISVSGTSEEDKSESEVRVPLVYASQYTGRVITAIQVRLDGVLADDFDIAMKAVSLKGYKDVININNGARNEADEVTSIITRATSSMSPDAYRLLYGLPYLSGGVQPVQWYTPNEPTKRDYLSFLTWDYAYYHAVPKLMKSGKLHTPEAHLPMFILDGDPQTGLFYFINTFSWDLLADEAEVEMESLQIEGTELTGASETITTTSKNR